MEGVACFLLFDINLKFEIDPTCTRLTEVLPSAWTPLVIGFAWRCGYSRTKEETEAQSATGVSLPWGNKLVLSHLCHNVLLCPYWPFSSLSRSLGEFTFFYAFHIYCRLADAG
eukprot:s94_g38.t1